MSLNFRDFYTTISIFSCTSNNLDIYHLSYSPRIKGCLAPCINTCYMYLNITMNDMCNIFQNMRQLCCSICMGFSLSKGILRNLDIQRYYKKFVFLRVLFFLFYFLFNHIYEKIRIKFEMTMTYINPERNFFLRDVQYLIQTVLCVGELHRGSNYQGK